MGKIIVYIALAIFCIVGNAVLFFSGFVVFRLRKEGSPWINPVSVTMACVSGLFLVLSMPFYEYSKVAGQSTVSAAVYVFMVISAIMLGFSMMSTKVRIGISMGGQDDQNEEDEQNEE